MFPQSMGYGGAPFGLSRGDDGVRERQRILDRAKRTHGGQTTIWKAGQEVKKICQRFGVGDIITLKPTPGKGIQVSMPGNLYGRIGGDAKFSDFVQDLVDAVEDCGYKLLVGDGYVELVKVDE